MQLKVYFISCGEHIKIGVARDPRNRLAALQTGNPFPLRLEAISNQFGSRPPLTDEAALHHRLRKHSVGGEWLQQITMQPMRCSNSSSCQDAL